MKKEILTAPARAIIRANIHRLAVLDAMAQAQEVAEDAINKQETLDYLLIDGCIDMALDAMERSGAGMPQAFAKAKALYNAACPTPNGKHPETSLRLVIHPLSADPLKEAIRAYFTAKRAFYFTQSPALYRRPHGPRVAADLDKLSDKETQATRKAFDVMAETMEELARAFTAEAARAYTTPEENARRKDAREIADYAREELAPLAARIDAFTARADEYTASPLHFHFMALAMVTALLPYIEEERTKEPLQKAAAALHDAAPEIDTEEPLFPVCWPAHTDTTGKRIRAYMTGCHCPEYAAAFTGYAIDFLNDCPAAP